MNRKVLRRLAAIAATAGCAAFGSATASAARVEPFDGGPTGSVQAAVQVLQTALFSLGIDQSLFGVAPSELATVGPVASSSSPSGNMLIATTTSSTARTRSSRRSRRRSPPHSQAR
jgi:hypothetical protein